ncbi:MAG: hypothetical protein WBK28_02665 [Minisyncoccia bacterium]
METPSHPKFVRWALMLGIVVVLNLFFLAARALAIPEPQYEDYCPVNTTQVFTAETCEAEEGTWIATPSDEGIRGASKPIMDGYCDFYQKCQPLFDEARKEYEMYAFVVMVGLGILSLIAGVVPMGSSIVSTGLSYGGVVALIIAAGSYWGEAGNLLRLGMSAVALVALLYIGIRRFRD